MPSFESPSGIPAKKSEKDAPASLSRRGLLKGLVAGTTLAATPFVKSAEQESYSPSSEEESLVQTTAAEISQSDETKLENIMFDPAQQIADRGEIADVRAARNAVQQRHLREHMPGGERYDDLINGLIDNKQWLGILHKQSEVYDAEHPLRLIALAIAESHLRTDARNEKFGATGIFQIIRSTGEKDLNGTRKPLTMTEFVDERYDPEIAADFAVALLRENEKTFRGDRDLARVGYNGWSLVKDFKKQARRNEDVTYENYNTWLQKRINATLADDTSFQEKVATFTKQYKENFEYNEKILGIEQALEKLAAADPQIGMLLGSSRKFEYIHEKIDAFTQKHRVAAGETLYGIARELQGGICTAIGQEYCPGVGDIVAALNEQNDLTADGHIQEGQELHFSYSPEQLRVTGREIADQYQVNYEEFCSANPCLLKPGELLPNDVRLRIPA